MLDSAQLRNLPMSGGCGDARGCALFLVAIGAVAAASVVISGSVVLVGNTIHWLEKQGKCPAGLGGRFN
ncbi:hypothetical protein AYO46_01400 [Betaproteobacteria bacterium SCGC AG-212-J23]|nr:hypothetical protein AYO46_01400 [Betaproteobacteria bacterium SCGC AG-212-J23]